MNILSNEYNQNRKNNNLEQKILENIVDNAD